MAIQHLTDEQVRTWSLEQKDSWWLTNVFRGNMPQLTLRSGITGFLIGGILSATNLYVGAKTGWTLGVGITSVILAFAVFKLLSSIGLAREFTILENNAMQSIATSAGYMTAPMISSLVAYMLVTNEVLPARVMMIWITAIAILGVLFAFPMKRRFINDEQQPFPEGRACGVVMDALHSTDAAVGILKAKILLFAALSAGFIKAIQAEGIMTYIQHKLLRISTGSVLHFHEFLDDYYHMLCRKLGWGVPKIGGVPLTELALRPSLDLAMVGAGGLMGIRTTTNLLLGALLNFAVIAPIMIHYGEIVGNRQPDGSVTYGRTWILNHWSLWWGVAMMVVASLVGFFAKPDLIIGAFRGLFGKRDPGSALLKHIELPMWVFVVGIPLVGGVTVWLANLYFGVEIWHGIIAIPLVFVLSLIAANSTALTSITPTGALSKITQLTFGALAPKNMQTNLMTAGITAEVASNASNLLMDIKPGYMLGAKPRQQAVGHVIGIFAGALAAVPLFMLLFMPHGKVDDLRGVMESGKFAMPAAVLWEAVARLLYGGLDFLPVSAKWAVVVAGVAGLFFEIIRIATKNRFPISPVAIGLGVVIPPESTFAMFLGAVLFWFAGRRFKQVTSLGYRVCVDNQEPICAGLIAGAALMGIADALTTVFLL